MDLAQAHALADKETHSSYQASFILRCWTNTPGQVRARLIDARSGRSYPVARLSDLPDLLHDLLQWDLPVSDNCSPQENKGGDGGDCFLQE